MAWGLLRPLYGLSTACKDWCKTIRDFLIYECGGKATSLDKSVFFWAQEGFSYEYGRRYRDPDKTNLGKNEFKVNKNFPNGGKRSAIGIISIRADGVLISGSDIFLEYISFRMKGIWSMYFWGNKETYLGMK